MGIARNLLKTAAKRVSTRLMDKVGSRVVAMTTDTSSDAPDAFYEPKRSLYEEMVAKEKAEEAASSQDHDPDHDHDHDHDHK